MNRKRYPIALQYHNGLKSWSESKKHNVKTPRKLFKHAHSVPKDIIDKSCGEVSIVEQDKIDYISTTYSEPKNALKCCS